MNYLELINRDQWGLSFTCPRCGVTMGSPELDTLENQVFDHQREEEKSLLSEGAEK